MLINKKSVLACLAAVSCYLSPALTLQATETQDEKPDWAKSNYRADSGLDFIGLSQLWVSGLAQAEAKSITEACTNGLGKVSEFFSVEIASKSSSSQVVVDDEFQGQFSVKTDKLSRINLTGISVTASYSERVEEGDYIQSYCLYRLTRAQVNEIKRDLAKEAAEIQTLISQFGAELNSGNIAQAKIQLALLKGKKNVSPVLIKELDALLVEFIKNNIAIDLVFGQHAFSANDILSVQLRSNQNVFVYLFVDDGQYTNMILPSPAYGFNLIKQDVALTVPTLEQKKKGNIYKLAKSHQGKKEPKVYLVASKQRLQTGFAKPAFNRFLVNDRSKFSDFLASCRLIQDCIVNQYPLMLDQTTSDFSIQSYTLFVNRQPYDDLGQNVKATLIEQGFKFDDKGLNLKFFINHKKVFSNKLEADMFVAELRLVSDVNSQNKTLLKMRFNSLYDESRTDFYIESMLKKATKKLMSKVEAGEVSY